MAAGISASFGQAPVGGNFGFCAPSFFQVALGMGHAGFWMPSGRLLLPPVGALCRSMNFHQPGALLTGL